MGTNSEHLSISQAENYSTLKLSPDAKLSEKFALLDKRAMDPAVSGAAKFAFSRLLLKFHNVRTDVCCPSHATLAASMGISDRAARTLVSNLSKVGWIKVEKRGRSTNQYWFSDLSRAGEKPRISQRPDLRLIVSEAANDVVLEEETFREDVVASRKETSAQGGRNLPAKVEGNFRSGWKFSSTHNNLGNSLDEQPTKTSSFESEREAKKEGAGLSRIGIPTSLRDKKDREFVNTWGPIFRSIAEEFGFTGKDEINRVHGEFVKYYIDGNGKDTMSSDWEGLIRSWCRKGAEIRKSKSSSSSSTQVPAELLDENHPNRAEFMRTLEPLAKKHGLQPTEWKDTLPRFKQMLGMPSSKALTVIEAWAIHLEDEKRKGNIQGTMKSRQRYAI